MVGGEIHLYDLANARVRQSLSTKVEEDGALAGSSFPFRHIFAQRIECSCGDGDSAFFPFPRTGSTSRPSRCHPGSV